MSLNKVTDLEIEIFSKCNRKCNWCPNSVIDRLSSNTYMSEEVYLKFLHDINKEISNKEKLKISYSRYNEPLLDVELLKKRINQAKDIIPNIITECNTNGDVLIKKGKETLKDLNLDILSIMDYDCKGIEHGKELFAKCEITNITNISITKSSAVDVYIQNVNHTNKLFGTHKNIPLIKYIADWPKNQEIQYRGGVLYDYENKKNKNIISNYGNKGKKLNFIKPIPKSTRRGLLSDNTFSYERKEPCSYPSRGIYVDYDGSVTPCCNIRNDVDAHKEFILGNINETPIKDIFNSEKATKFRETLASWDYKNYPSPCKFCLARCNFGTKPNKPIKSEFLKNLSKEKTTK